MTSLGHIYERVSGETRRVTDPAHLDALFRRGQAAHETAERRATQAAIDITQAVDLGSGHGAVAVAIAPVARETDDIGSRLFVPVFAEVAEQAVRRLVPGHEAARTGLSGHRARRRLRASRCLRAAGTG